MNTKFRLFFIVTLIFGIILPLSLQSHGVYASEGYAKSKSITVWGRIKPSCGGITLPFGVWPTL